MRSTIKRYCIVKLLLAFCLVLSNITFAKPDSYSDRENQLKSVYMIHFAELTRWPESVMAAETFNICLYQNTTLQPYLNELKKEPVIGKPLRLIVIDELEQEHDCHILYFSEDHTDNPDLINQANRNAFLLVGNSRLFIQNNGSISFNIANNKLKLIINLAPIRQKGMDINSKLLRISEVVE